MATSSNEYSSQYLVEQGPINISLIINGSENIETAREELVELREVVAQDPRFRATSVESFCDIGIEATNAAQETCRALTSCARIFNQVTERLTPAEQENISGNFSSLGYSLLRSYGSCKNIYTRSCQAIVRRTEMISTNIEYPLAQQCNDFLQSQIEEIDRLPSNSDTAEEIQRIGNDICERIDQTTTELVNIDEQNEQRRNVKEYVKMLGVFKKFTRFLMCMAKSISNVFKRSNRGLGITENI